MSHVIAIANQKGGVGKTTTAVNLAAGLAAAGRKTCLIDMDPQGNATSGLGIDRQSLPLTIYDLLLEESLSPERILLNPLMENLFLLPSNIQLIGAEIELLSSPRKEYRLRRIIESFRDRFSYIIIDSPPSLGLLTVNTLTAANRLIIPVQCEYYALEGLSLLMETLRRIRSVFNPELHLLGLLITMYDSRTNLSRQVADDVRGHFGELVFRTIISRTVKLSEAPSYGRPIILYDPNCTGSNCYSDFSKEVIERLEHPDFTIHPMRETGVSPSATSSDAVEEAPVNQIPVPQEVTRDQEEKEGPGQGP